eukprot:SAG11_NODE_34279_length_271_cov_29.832370_1_plen_49_part_10
MGSLLTRRLHRLGNISCALSAWVDAYHGFDAKPKCTLDPLPPLATPLMT